MIQRGGGRTDIRNEKGNTVAQAGDLVGLWGALDHAAVAGLRGADRPAVDTSVAVPWRRDRRSPPRFELAQVNIGRLLAPVDSAEIADFVAGLDQINALADTSPGFIWRLQTDAGNATSVRSFDDELIISNLSVWASIEALRAFTYTSAHTGFMSRRREWFKAYGTAYMALWWVPADHRPTIEEAKERLAALDRNGPTPFAFTFRAPFEPPSGLSRIFGGVVPFETGITPPPRVRQGDDDDSTRQPPYLALGCSWSVLLAMVLMAALLWVLGQLGFVGYTD